jgi:acetylornithine/succinyldiaminopimelate/putrescine aminotransferase
MGKGMASGMPVGAFTTSSTIMHSLQHSPKLGHITTFGGNPVIAAASLATLKELVNTNLIDEIPKKEKLFKHLLKHTSINEIRGKGLMLALILKNENLANELVLKAMEKGLILFWLLFEPKAVRISPPLTISESEIKKGCFIIRDILDELQQ